MICHTCPAEVIGDFWFDITKCKGNVRIIEQALCPKCSLEYIEQEINKLKYCRCGHRIGSHRNSAKQADWSCQAKGCKCVASSFPIGLERPKLVPKRYRVTEYEGMEMIENES